MRKKKNPEHTPTKTQTFNLTSIFQFRKTQNVHHINQTKPIHSKPESRAPLSNASRSRC